MLGLSRAGLRFHRALSQPISVTPILSRNMEKLEDISIGPEREQKLACVDKFCYLVDMIGAGGGAEEASRAVLSNMQPLGRMWPAG